MEQLEFDERVAEQLEAFYRTRDVLRRRSLALAALGAQPGDDVVDVGCGPGFYAADLLDAVGEEGSVTAVEPAPAMRAIAARRVEGRPNARVVEGDASSIPLDDTSVDRALSVQVFEYVPDVAAGLAEIHRVLRPGGRVVIWDIDWSTLSLHASDAERNARMLAAWDRHLAHPTLPRTLGPALRDAGFEDVEVEGHLFATRSLDPETFGGYLPTIVEGYLRGLDDVDDADVEAWAGDLRELDARGEYFFALTQFCFAATRSG